MSNYVPVPHGMSPRVFVGNCQTCGGLGMIEHPVWTDLFTHLDDDDHSSANHADWVQTRNQKYAAANLLPHQVFCPDCFSEAC